MLYMYMNIPKSDLLTNQVYPSLNKFCMQDTSLMHVEEHLIHDYKW